MAQQAHGRPERVGQPGSWFVSDLHKFAQRSEAARWEPAIRRAVRAAHTFVLGGDIFDFRWRVQPTVDAAIRDSIAWLERLIEVNPECQFHYLLGNHDSQPRFVAALQRLASQHPRLAWHRHFLRVGERVFLHGDVVDRALPDDECHHRALDARRDAADLRPDPARVSHALYEAVVRTGMHRVAARLAVRQRRVLERLDDYLERAGAGLADGVTEVYFGHIHRPLDGVPWRGRRFHNPGAAIRGLQFRLVDAGLPHPGIADHGSARQGATDGMDS